MKPQKETLLAVFILRMLIFKITHNDESRKSGKTEIICESLGKNNEIKCIISHFNPTCFDTSDFQQWVKEPIQIQDIRCVMQALKIMGWEVYEQGTFENTKGKRTSFFIKETF